MSGAVGRLARPPPETHKPSSRASSSSRGLRLARGRGFPSATDTAPTSVAPRATTAAHEPSPYPSSCLVLAGKCKAYACTLRRAGGGEVRVGAYPGEAPDDDLGSAVPESSQECRSGLEWQPWTACRSRRSSSEPRWSLARRWCGGGASTSVVLTAGAWRHA